MVLILGNRSMAVGGSGMGLRLKEGSQVKFIQRAIGLSPEEID